MTSLAAQLQVVASAGPREERLRGKASLLYELREAADIDLATIYAVGSQGAPPGRSRRPRNPPPRAPARPVPPPPPPLAPAATGTAAPTSPSPFAPPVALRLTSPRSPPSRSPSHPSTRSPPAPLGAGFSELCRLDGRFDAYAKALFSRSASETNRELQDKEANAKLDASLEGFLRLLSGFFLNPAATKALEYLIRRFKIHVFNVDAAVACALPYHSTPEFVRLVQLCALDGTGFYFLAGVKATGAAPPRDQLVKRCVNDAAFFSFVCEAAATAASNKVSARGTMVEHSPRRTKGDRLPSEETTVRVPLGPDALGFFFFFFFFFSARPPRPPAPSSSALETRLGPPPFLPSDEAAIRGVKTNPRRTRTSRAVVHPDTFEREDLSAPRCPRSQRTAQTAMDGGAYWPSLIITTF